MSDLKKLLKDYSDYEPLSKNQEATMENTYGIDSYVLYLNEYTLKWTPSKKEAILGRIFKDLSDAWTTEKG